MGSVHGSISPAKRAADTLAPSLDESTEIDETLTSPPSEVRVVRGCAWVGTYRMPTIICVSVAAGSASMSFVLLCRALRAK